MISLRILRRSPLTPFCAAFVIFALFLLATGIEKGSQDAIKLVKTKTDPASKTAPTSPGGSPLVLPAKAEQVKEDCVTQPFNFEGASQTDPKLIDYIRKELLKPPSPHKYNLRRPEAQHYSQLGQSEFADKTYLHGMRDGFFIEAGAVDGEHLSNSLYFEKELGWRGLLVEAFPETYEKLIKKNRNAYSANVALAVTTNASKVTFNPRGNLGELSGLRADGTLKVTAIPLFSLILALDIKVVDFLSLDIESYEVKVLKTIPWDKVKFRLMCIEVNHIPEGIQHLTGYLAEKGYKFLGTKSIDAWYGMPSLLNETMRT